MEAWEKEITKIGADLGEMTEIRQKTRKVDRKRRELDSERKA